jgi:hypothetical protein
MTVRGRNWKRGSISHAFNEPGFAVLIKSSLKKDKHPVPSTKSQINPNDRNPRQNRLGHLKLKFGAYSEFGI